MEMESACEKCQGMLTDEPYVFICSNDCIFCRKCAATLRGICPNCEGHLVRHSRPRDEF